MATLNNIHVTDALLAELREKALAEGTSVDALVEDVLRKGLDQRAWQDILAYGRERGAASGCAEHDVPEVIREWRRGR